MAKSTREGLERLAGGSAFLGFHVNGDPDAARDLVERTDDLFREKYGADPDIHDPVHRVLYNRLLKRRGIRLDLGPKANGASTETVLGNTVRYLTKATPHDRSQLTSLAEAAIEAFQCEYGVSPDLRKKVHRQMFYQALQDQFSRTPFNGPGDDLYGETDRVRHMYDMMMTHSRMNGSSRPTKDYGA